MQLHQMLCVSKDPQKIGGGGSCFVPIGHGEAKVKRRENLQRTMDVARFTGPLAINPNCGDFSVSPELLY